MQGPADVQGAQAQAAQSGYQPSLQNYQMGPAQQVRTQDFNAPGIAQSYMSPYMQSVVAQQQQEAQRQANIQNTALGAQAAKSGAFGGSRYAIEQAQANRALQTQLGNIQAQGLQNAYTQGQQQFNAQQQAALQAQQANQQAGLTTGQANLNAALGVQGLGAQYGTQMALANLGNVQQANLQNAQLSQQANLANQQAGLTTGQANLNALLGIQSLGAGQNLAAQQANQQMNLATQQAQQQANQFGYGQGMTAAQLQAQYGLGANQLNANQQQFGANLGLQGLQAGMTGYSALGAQGQNLYNQNVGNITLQNQLGTQQQQNAQNILNTGYQDWLTAQQYPQTQMDTLQSYIRGTPLNTVGSSTTTAAPSTVSQIAGLGTAAAGMYGMYNKAQGNKKGGVIKAKKADNFGGLEALALSKLA